MARIIIGLCTLELSLPGVTSLKEKRSIIKSLLKRMHNQFNVSASEIDHQDLWQSAVIAFAAVTNSTSHAHQTLSIIQNWIEANFPDAQIVAQDTEIL